MGCMTIWRKSFLSGLKQDIEWWILAAKYASTFARRFFAIAWASSLGSGWLEMGTGSCGVVEESVSRDTFGLEISEGLPPILWALSVEPTDTSRFGILKRLLMGPRVAASFSTSGTLRLGISEGAVLLVPCLSKIPGTAEDEISVGVLLLG